MEDFPGRIDKYNVSLAEEFNNQTVFCVPSVECELHNPLEMDLPDRSEYGVSQVFSKIPAELRRILRFLDNEGSQV